MSTDDKWFVTVIDGGGRNELVMWNRNSLGVALKQTELLVDRDLVSAWAGD